MNYKIDVIPRTLCFKRPAGTSRGVYIKRKVWYLRVTDKENPSRVGIGECAPLPDLSCDALPDYEQIVNRLCREIEEGSFDDNKAADKYPSIAFGLETAMTHLNENTLAFGHTDFSEGKRGIPINGLIWMGDYSYMFEQIKTKIEDGFRCIKLKIGAIHFEEELALIRYIRQQFSAKEIELRVDANGAFSFSDAIEKLKRLSDWEIHSIEQPIRAGYWDEMAEIVRLSPVPIALDEELIGYNTEEEQQRLLEHIHPHYIVIKPSLHGRKEHWISLAETMKIGWWATSALESNIGLNAIAQWVSGYEISRPQGLGTGLLYTENVDIPLEIVRDELWYRPYKQCVLNL